jgi:uncharacterized damage-inducible protein DinB
MTNEQARFLAEQFVSLMSGEVPTTLKVLSAVTDEGRAYRPDEKSRTAWELATHIAQADVWFLDSVINGRFARDAEGSASQLASLETPADVVAFYGREVPARLETIRAMPPEDLTRIVDFFGMVQWPAVKFMGLANNHGIHHRGQLAGYLRAMGSRVPAIYGGSADEPFKAS